LRDHDEAAFNEFLQQHDDPKLKSLGDYVAVLPWQAEIDRERASLARSEEVIEPPKPRPVQRPVMLCIGGTPSPQ
jgi:hypothetical protein